VIVGDFLVITGANDIDYIGSTGVILLVTETTIIVSLAAAGENIPDDLTNVSFVVYNHPIFAALDNGDIHNWIGSSPDARFGVSSPYGHGNTAVNFELTAGVESHTGFNLDFDADTYIISTAQHINFNASQFDSDEHLGKALDIVVLNANATAGDFHAIDVSKSDPTDTNLEVEALATHQGVDVVAQYLSEAATLNAGFVYDASLTTYTDRTTEFNSGVSDVQIFVEVNDQILLASANKFDLIDIINSIDASHTILPVSEYIEDDGKRTVNEVTGAGADVDYYWIRITRTRKILPTPPTENIVQVSTIGAKHYWNATGDVFTNSVAIVDGITAPSAIAGQAIVYVDVADGDLKVVFGDGFVATIATDS